MFVSPPALYLYLHVAATQGEMPPLAFPVQDPSSVGFPSVGIAVWLTRAEL